MTRWYFLALAAVPLLFSFLRPPANPELVWWTTHALDKIRPYDKAPTDAAHVAKIHAARNEFEPFQIILRAEGQDMDGLDVEVTDFGGTNGVIPAKDAVTVYLERYIDLKIPSSIEGGTGEWPDALVPRVDRYAHEKRNAFPFKALKGRNQPLWVDVYVPQSARPGSYHAQIRVQAANQVLLTVPVDLEVWNFALPSTSSLPTAFGFSGNTADRAHFGKYTSDKDVYDLTSLYQKAGLWHRITLDGSSGVAPTVAFENGDVHLNWGNYDAQIGPFMDGKVSSGNEPLPGARATSAALHTPHQLKSPEQQVKFWQQASRHFRQKGWFDRLFNYLWDEPQPADYPAVTELGKTVHQADPALKNLVTAPLQQDWVGVVDIWTPVINCFERKAELPDYCKIVVARSGYDSELVTGKELWWYQSCSSHGCNVVGGDYFRGWPSYMIDSTGTHNRIMEWLTWKYGVHGELYFSTNEAFGKKKDPWQDLSLFGGNGDGTLFYPGRPDVIGGTTPIPIESLRLKLVREGLEDYEYLSMLTKLRDYQTVAHEVNGFIRNTHDYDQDPKKLYAVREWMGQALNQAAKQ